MNFKSVIIALTAATAVSAANASANGSSNGSSNGSKSSTHAGSANQVVGAGVVGAVAAAGIALLF